MKKNEIRYNPFWGRSVVIASNRQSRPWSGELSELEGEKLLPYDPDCYLCPGNKRAGGKVNPDYTDTWSFANDFPSLDFSIQSKVSTETPYMSMPANGICEVLIYSPDHSKSLSTMDVSNIVKVTDMWQETYSRLESHSEIDYVLIFENRGMIMGNSQPHPHGQVYAYTEIPDLIARHQIFEFQKTEECFVCKTNEFEKKGVKRIVSSNDSFLAFVPFAATLPYEVIITPVKHYRDITELSTKDKRSLAQILKQVLTGLDNLFNIPFHYTLAIVQSPTDGNDYDYHFQIHIVSLLRGPGIRKHIVGADMFGYSINPSDPDVCAEEIRKAVGK
ncbi:galactose-1-phosphate uridylyltransferase [candidate division KSB1 bacterium]